MHPSLLISFPPSLSSQSSGGASECLFVFERLSLEADPIEDFGTVELLPDPTSCSSYFIKHAVGIHRMVLPWADFLNSYVSNEGMYLPVLALCTLYTEAHFMYLPSVHAAWCAFLVIMSLH